MIGLRRQDSGQLVLRFLLRYFSLVHFYRLWQRSEVIWKGNLNGKKDAGDSAPASGERVAYSSLF